MSKQIIRASKVPLLLKCNGGALNQCEQPFKPKYKATDIGSAVHEALCYWVLDNHVDLFEVAEKHNVLVRDIKSLFYTGVNYLDRAQVDIKENGSAEVFYQANLSKDIILTGHMDLILFHDNHYEVIDWKTGEEREDEDQLKTYCLILYLCGHNKPEYYATTVYLRHGNKVTYKYTPEDLEKHAEKITKAANEFISFNPGEHCMFCENQLECKVKQQYSKNCVQALSATEFSGISNDVLGELIPKAREYREVLDRFDKLVKERGKTEALKDSTGQLYRSVEMSRDNINKAKAIEVLREYCTEKEIISLFTNITKQSIRDMLGGKDMKLSTNLKKILTKIDEKGGITKSKFYQFRKVKK